ncbi:MAG TPA: hypothetical protein PK357_02375 [Candidatus Pacearchaeota archaeon]|nr:hypothetical protein [Candidatus Pacearchaeota archaeon]
MSNLKKPSKEFEEAVIDLGSILIDCQLCGRNHFGSDEQALIDYIGKEEYNALLKNAKENPDKYVQHDTEMVSWGNIDGNRLLLVANAINWLNMRRLSGIIDIL